MWEFLCESQQEHSGKDVAYDVGYFLPFPKSKETQPVSIFQTDFRAGQAKGPRNLLYLKPCSHPFPRFPDLPDAVLHLIPIQTLLMYCEMILLKQHKHLVFSLD